MADSLITYINDGPKIVESNFWTLPDRGFLVSINAGGLSPFAAGQLAEYLSEMAAAREVAISRGPWPKGHLKEAFELLLDDGSPEPVRAAYGARVV